MLPEFNDFLFAYIGEEKNGVPLTVLSAFARLGLDPWGEAARISRLSREAATSAVLSMISRLPEGNWNPSEARMIAVRLVKDLPRKARQRAGDIPVGRSSGRAVPAEVRKWTVLVGPAVAILIVVCWLITHQF